MARIELKKCPFCGAEVDTVSVNEKDGNLNIEVKRKDTWIPCSERLPNEAGKYIVCGRWHGEKPKTWICQFIIFGDIGGFANHAENPPISFWMPLPEPPEKE